MLGRPTLASFFDWVRRRRPTDPDGPDEQKCDTDGSGNVLWYKSPQTALGTKCEVG